MKNNNIVIGEQVDKIPPNIIFYGKDKTEILRLESNGDIYVKNRFVENDKEVVDGLRLFLSSHRGINL